jgi:hypothetical protein
MQIKPFINFLFALLATSAFVLPCAAGTGELQLVAVAFIDFEAYVPNTLNACTQVDPSLTQELQSLYLEFKRKHLPYQIEVRDYLIARFQRTPELADMLEKIKSAAPNLAEEHFPQNTIFKTNAFCSTLLMDSVRGKRLMNLFKDYATEIREHGDLKFFRSN